MESGSKRRRSVTAVIFIFCAISCFKSVSPGQVGTNYDEIFNSDHIPPLCIYDRYIMQSYFTTRTCLNDSEFRNYLLRQECSDKDPNTVAAPAVSLLQGRNITGEGSHRNLFTSIKLLRLVHHSQSHLNELVVVERLPLGVFADPFELQSLQQRRAFRDVSVFGDTNLELPSFRSNRSVVEIHVEISSRDYENGEISLKLPLHARYQVKNDQNLVLINQTWIFAAWDGTNITCCGFGPGDVRASAQNVLPLEESGYSRVEFGEPDLFLCSSYVPNQEQEQRTCMVLSIGGSSKTGEENRSLVWEIPAGIRDHTEYVSAFTFAAAVLSAFSILAASVLSSKVESCKNSKQS